MRVYDITAFSTNNVRGAVLERENKRKLEKEKNIYTSLKIERIVLKISRYFLPSLFLPLLLQIPHLDDQIAKSDSKPFSLPSLERVITTVRTTKIKKNRKSDAKKELLCLKPERKRERKDSAEKKEREARKKRNVRTVRYKSHIVSGNH